MSLEARIELLTAAVIELTAAIGGMQASASQFTDTPQSQWNEAQIASAVAQQQAQLEEIAKEAERIGNSIKINDLPPANDDEAKAQIEAERARPNEPLQSTPPISQTSAEESKPVAYSDVAKLVTQIAKTDLAKAKAALARLGVKNGKELTEAQWPQAVTYLTRVAAGEVDPETSHE